MARRRYFGRRRHHGGGGGLLRSAENIGKLAAFSGPLIGEFLLYRSDPKAAINAAIEDYTGYNPIAHTYNAGALLRGWGPIATFMIAAKVFHKVNGLLRRV